MDAPGAGGHGQGRGGRVGAAAESAHAPRTQRFEIPPSSIPLALTLALMDLLGRESMRFLRRSSFHEVMLSLIVVTHLFSIEFIFVPIAQHLPDAGNYWGVRSQKNGIFSKVSNFGPTVLCHGEPTLTPFVALPFCSTGHKSLGRCHPSPKARPSSPIFTSPCVFIVRGSHIPRPPQKKPLCPLYVIYV